MMLFCNHHCQAVLFSFVQSRHYAVVCDCTGPTGCQQPQCGPGMKHSTCGPQPGCINSCAVLLSTSLYSIMASLRRRHYDHAWCITCPQLIVGASCTHCCCAQDMWHLQSIEAPEPVSCMLATGNSTMIESHPSGAAVGSVRHGACT